MLAAPRPTRFLSQTTVPAAATLRSFSTVDGMYAILAPGTGPSSTAEKNRSISLIVSGKYHHGRILQDDFHHKLGGGRPPPLETEGSGPESTREGGLEVSRIIHRQSKSAILDPEAFQSVTRKDRVGEPMASLTPPAAPAVALLQLAFELARENNLFRGCEKALESVCWTKRTAAPQAFSNWRLRIVVQPNEKCLPRCSDRGKRIIPFPTRSRPAFFAKETPC